MLIIIVASVVVSAMFIYQIYRMKKQKAFEMLEQLFKDAFDDQGLEFGEPKDDETPE